MTPANRILFVDLDGTLTLDNSFHRFLIAIWRLGGWRARGGLFLAASERLIRRDSSGRVRMKRRVLLAFGRVPDDSRAAVVQAVIDDVTRTLSEPVLRVVERWREAGGDVVLATAAPDCYAQQIASDLDFRDVIATPTDVSESWVEVLGTEKAERCVDWLAVNAPRATVGVITDHLDDVPLVGRADTVWVQGTARDLEAIRVGGRGPFAAELIDAESPQEGGGMWLWFDDRPSGPHDVWEVRTILSKHRYGLIYIGSGRWVRVRAGDDLGVAVQRRNCPRPPSTKDRLSIDLRRRAVRDRLGVFH